jgi:hypothetical protein
MLAAHKNAVSVLRIIAPWVVVIADAVLAALGMWAMLRQYGISTVGSEPPLVPTPWETGSAPYILGLLAAVFASAILTAAGHRLGRYALMAVTTIHTLCLLILAAQFTMSMRPELIQWTAKTALLDFEYLVAVISWWFISYWSLFRARRLTIGSSDRRVASSLGRGESR